MPRGPRRAPAAVALATTLLAAGAAGAQPLRPARLFSDGMVLQRGVALPVWGTAAPGARVTVTFDGRSAAGRADGAGRWTVRLPAHAAGGPYTLALAAGADRRTLRDVLVGDVWVASGQSNMEWTLENARDARLALAAARDPGIRHFKVPLSWAARPSDTLTGGAWERTDPEHARAFTAVGYFFARGLRERAPNVPVGILNTTWGGSRIEAWMSDRALGLDSAGMQGVMVRERARDDTLRAHLAARIGALPTRDAGLVDGVARWAAPALADTTGWLPIAVPAAWESVGYDGMDGVAWYRTTFDLTAADAARGVTLGVGMIDDSDRSWVNGVEVGHTEQAWNRPRVYRVPPAALRVGRNVIAVRVEDTGGGGGITGDSSLLFVEAGGARRALAGPWRLRVGEARVTSSGQNQRPTLLWNQMVHPILRFPVKGVIWYQGESNAENAADAAAYRRLFPAMIRDWRARWGGGDFPFLWVQLAGFMAVDSAPAESNWALLRESQTATLAVPRTGQALALDVGQADDIHPRNKQEVGRRLALAARAVAYGDPAEASGPVYRAHAVQNGRVTLTFDHRGGGLVAPGGPLGGFAVAGADRRWVWADARIVGDRVEVWSDAVPAPVAVRYAWGNNPAAANLYNADGLPATPFRTDRW